MADIQAETTLVFIICFKLMQHQPVLPNIYLASWSHSVQFSCSVKSLVKLMSIESLMPSNHLILCHPLLLPSIFPSIRVFSNESVLCIRNQFDSLLGCMYRNTFVLSVSDSLRPHGQKPARFLFSWDFPGKKAGGGCHFLLQGIFPTQEQNQHLLHLLHCQAGSSPLAPPGQPHIGQYREIIYNLYFKMVKDRHKISKSSFTQLGSQHIGQSSPALEPIFLTTVLKNAHLTFGDIIFRGQKKEPAHSFKFRIIPTTIHYFKSRHILSLKY